MVRGSEAREARPPAATGEAVREGKHAETAALKGVTKKQQQQRMTTFYAPSDQTES